MPGDDPGGGGEEGWIGRLERRVWRRGRRVWRRGGFDRETGGKGLEVGEEGWIGRLGGLDVGSRRVWRWRRVSRGGGGGLG